MTPRIKEALIIKGVKRRSNKNDNIVFSHLEERLDLGVEPPPLPVPQLEVRGAVPLEDADGVQLLGPLHVVPE